MSDRKVMRGRMIRGAVHPLFGIGAEALDGAVGEAGGARDVAVGEAAGDQIQRLMAPAAAGALTLDRNQRQDLHP